jgi:hypothetical protein
MSDSDSPPLFQLRFGCPSARLYRRVSRHRRKRWGLLRSWGTSGRSPPSQTPVGPLRLAMRTTLGVGSCCSRRLSPTMPVPHSSPSSLSLRLAAPRFRPRSLHSAGYPRQSTFRSSITRLSSSLSTLRSLPSRSRGRTTTQDSLPAGGQPLPGGGHNPARSRMKFQPLLHGFLLTQVSQRNQRPSWAANVLGSPS